METLRRCSYVLALLGFLSAFSAFAGDQSIQLIPRHTRLGLGFGYNSKTGQVLPPCVEGEVVKDPTRSSDLDLQLSGDGTRLRLNQVMQTGAEVDLFLVGGEVNSQFHSDLRAVDNSLTYSYNFSYQGDSYHLKRLQLTRRGQEVAALRSESAINQHCGDRYISAFLPQGNLRMALRFTFDRQHLEQHIIAEIKIKVGFYRRTKRVRIDLPTIHQQHGMVSVELYQDGGNESAMRRFRSKHSSSCELSDMDKCNQLLTEYMKYATVDFPQQMRITSDLSVNHRVSGMPMMATSYKGLGLFESSVPVSMGWAYSHPDYRNLKSNYESAAKLLAQRQLLQIFEPDSIDPALIREAERKQIALGLKLDRCAERSVDCDFTGRRQAPVEREGYRHLPADKTPMRFFHGEQVRDDLLAGARCATTKPKIQQRLPRWHPFQVEGIAHDDRNAVYQSLRLKFISSIDGVRSSAEVDPDCPGPFVQDIEYGGRSTVDVQLRSHWKVLEWLKSMELDGLTLPEFNYLLSALPENYKSLLSVQLSFQRKGGESEDLFQFFQEFNPVTLGRCHDDQLEICLESLDAFFRLHDAGSRWVQELETSSLNTLEALSTKGYWLR